MNTFFKFAAAAGLVALAACVQMPTEKSSVSDLRPQISFRTDGDAADDARVRVDGLDVGRVADFREGKAAVRVLPGNHVVTVVSGDRVLLEQRVYLNDGVSRSFLVK